MEKNRGVSRRDFMRSAASAGAAIGGLTILGATAKGQGKTFKVGLIGCGGRGRGALGFNLQAAKTLGMTVQVVGMADYFKDRAEAAGKKHSVPKERCFGGADCYRKLLETDVELWPVVKRSYSLFSSLLGNPLMPPSCLRVLKESFLPVSILCA